MSSRRRVLLLAPSLAGGGAERVFSTLLRNLDRNRFELHFGVLEAIGSYMADVPDDVQVHVMNVSRVRYALPGVLRLVRKLRPNVVLSTLSHLNLMLIMAKVLMPGGVRLLVREPVASVAYTTEKSHPRLWRWLCRRLYRHADRVVCLSEFLVKDMVENFGVPRERTVRIYNPIDVGRVLELAVATNNPFQQGSPKLVAAGRLTRQKGFDLAIEALTVIKSSFPDVHLTILGEGPLQQELAAQAQRLGVRDHVDFAGFRANPWVYFKHADVFVFPSRYEGMPNALLEALALGTPAVAANCPGGIAEIQDCDDQLTLIPMDDPIALAHAVIESYSRPRRVPESVEKVERRMEKFSLRKVVNQYSNLLEA